MPSKKQQLAAKGSVRGYQKQLKCKLIDVFPNEPVEIEWAAMRDEQGLYSPRLDAAIGPFATHDVYIAEYERLVINYRPLLTDLFNMHSVNLRKYGQLGNQFDFEHVCERNLNARCFLAIEIENAVSRKHLMGGAINAAALGRIGIAIAWNEEKLRAFIKLRSYLLFLSNVGKNTFDPSNLLILNKEQLMVALDSFLTNQRQQTGESEARR
ncbi:MAG: hypothetical protein HGA87_03120 [Desulfobulbaceae bacterium]|nr:hypothetical protein [Desulfobulbaceae bacterium]